MTLEAELEAIVGPNGMVDDDDAGRYLRDWRGRAHAIARCIVRPASVAQTAAVVKACRAAGAAVVTQGGNTGLCGGAVPDDSATQVLVSLERMNRVLDVDTGNDTLTAEAGCTLAAVCTATIGGNVSTDAGGVNVLRYGTARAQVLGLEVVLPDGRVWNGLRQLRKNTAGYDLKQLFIGAEGTLGIVTRVVLRLRPRPRTTATALAAVTGAGQGLQLLRHLQHALGERISAFEWLSDVALHFSIMHTDGARAPFDQAQSVALIEVADAAGIDVTEPLSAALAEALQASRCTDAIVAVNERQAQMFWRLRHNVSAAQKSQGASIKHDISLPPAATPAFLEEASVALRRQSPGVRICAFGHLGDGNLHYNLSRPAEGTDEAFLESAEALTDTVYDAVARVAGSISAEHGIGQFKRDAFLARIDPLELELMRRMKAALDPDGVMNPGKVI
ncbi:MAG: FAD-binding oxidoreductase [Pseudomonadota bacterium]